MQKMENPVESEKPNYILLKPSNDEFKDNYEHSNNVMRVLNGNFQLRTFEDIQLPVINAALLGHNCFVIMPTGVNKSLCYQIPALLSDGITVIISPLKAIVYDQIQKLHSLNIDVAHISGEQSNEELNNIITNLENLNPKILYVIADKLRNSSVLNSLHNLHSKKLISRFVIDEAHCVSDATHAFRASCNIPHEAKKLFEYKVQIMAFTSSATPCVQQDIIKQLNLKEFKFFSSSLNRPNLKYSALMIPPSERTKMVAQFIHSKPQNYNGIAFCHTKIECNQLASELLNKFNICSVVYHSDVIDSNRILIQNAWQANQIQVVCATYAFGTGIEKKDVRYILHYSMPEMIEHYFQETGLAGHDGELAECILYYDDSDYVKFSNLKESEKPNYILLKHSNDEFKDNYVHSNTVMSVLNERFQLKEFEDIQLPVINAALFGHNCFVIMPTGVNKSLCYQIPALLSGGITVIISPLKAIVYDQIQKLQSLNIDVAHISGEQSNEELNNIITNLENLNPKILYVIADKLRNSSVLNSLHNLHSKKLISRFVIDEAHCVSDATHAFRASCNIPHEAKKLFEYKVQIMAFTSSATPCVQQDIIKQLNLKEFKFFSSSLNRPNLKYSALMIPPSERTKMVAQFIHSKPQNYNGIAFCHTKIECNQLASELLNKFNICSVVYHSDVIDSNRILIQNAWQANQIQVVCATYAFGTGIEKKDVRYILHYSMPEMIEHYFQETGLAGHDGELAECILYYDDSDYVKFSNLKVKNKEDLFHMVAYCNNKVDCRRYQLLNYFGEKFNTDKCLENPETVCDNCQEWRMKSTVSDNCHEWIIKQKKIRDAIISLFSNQEVKYSMDAIIGAIRASPSDIVDDNPVDIAEVKRQIVILVNEGYLYQDIEFEHNAAKSYIKLMKKDHLN